MKQPTNSREKDGNRITRRFKKAVRFILPKPEPETSASSSPPNLHRPKAVVQPRTRPAGDHPLHNGFSGTDIMNMTLQEDSRGAINPSVDPALNSTGTPLNAAKNAPVSDLGVLASPSNMSPSISVATELSKVAANSLEANESHATHGEPPTPSNILLTGNTNPNTTATPSSAAAPNVGTNSGLNKSNSISDRTLVLQQPGSAKTADGASVVPDPNAVSTDGRKAQLWLQSNNTPKWNNALQTLRENNPEMHKELEETKKSLEASQNRNTDEFFRLDIAKPQEKAVVQRWKRYLPSFADVRGIAMTAAAWDPHKVAPIVCACVFFSIDLAFNTLSPEAKGKMRNIVFECVIAINEWISFESNFRSKRHAAIHGDVRDLEGLLTSHYLEALRLLCDILLSRNGSWTKRAGDKVTSRFVEYENRLGALKDSKLMWASKKKLVEEKLSSEKAISDVLEWIKKDGDPEESWNEIETRVTSGKRHLDCAGWILRRQDFQKWSSSWVSQEMNRSSKRMMWVNGPYVTGKTTIVYRVVSELQGLSENCLRRDESEISGDERQPDRPLRVIPYFCTTLSGDSTRADYLTIIRALAQKMSLMPGFTLAKQAEMFYNDHSRDLKREIDDPDPWENFLRSLLSDDNGASDFVFVIDALDGCDSTDEPEDSERLLEFMRDLMRDFSNVQILCSSRQHVPVRTYFPDEVIYLVDALSAPPDEMKNFIRSEVILRRDKQPDSIFVRNDAARTGCEDLRELLERYLIDHADGMYEWVSIWLKVAFPAHNKRDIIRLREDAKNLLNSIKESSHEANTAYEKLKFGYQRLWDLGALRGFDELRVRLFRLIFSSCEPLDTSDLIAFLQIPLDNGLLQEGLSFQDIESLYSNFLVRGISKSVVSSAQPLMFTHGSARAFIIREILGKTSVSSQGALVSSVNKDNHHHFVRLFVETVSPLDHVEVSPHRIFEGSPEYYFTRHGFTHCIHAAKKASIFDEIWRTVSQQVLLSPKLALVRDCWPPRLSGCFSATTGDHTKDRFLFAHAATLLNIIHDDDLTDLQCSDLRAEVSQAGSPEDILRHFAQHASLTNCSGYNAVTVACQERNVTAVSFILEITLKLFGKDACIDLLSIREQTEYSPFNWTLRRLNKNIQKDSLGLWKMDPDLEPLISIAETLIRFETRHLETAGDEEEKKSRQPTHKAQQWGAGGTYSNLSYAIGMVEEDICCRLLKIAEPSGVNGDADCSLTPLCLAAILGRLKIVRILVEDYHADITIEMRGRTALNFARDKNQRAVVDYLEERMCIREPWQSVKLGSDAENDSC